MITQTDLFEFFDRQISKTAIRQLDGDGDFEVVGKWCCLALDTDENGEATGDIDIYICNPADRYNRLGQRKVRSILRGLNALDGSGALVNREFIELTGEAWGKTRDKTVVLSNLGLLGIRRKRRVSPEQAAAAEERLRRHRPNQAKAGAS